MRCTQYVGLNDRAANLIQKDEYWTPLKETVIREFPDGRKETVGPFDTKMYLVEISKSPHCSFGIGDEEVPFNKYICPDGKVYIEKEQNVIWSSGPMIFTAFTDENDNWVQESLWTEEEMNNA